MTRKHAHVIGLECNTCRVRSDTVAGSDQADAEDRAKNIGWVEVVRDCLEGEVRRDECPKCARQSRTGAA